MIGEGVMIIDLDKEDIICLLRGRSPSYKQMNDPVVKEAGYYSGSYQAWSWNSLEDKTEDELLALYSKCKGKELKPISLNIS